MLLGCRYQFFLQVKLDILQGRLPVAQDLAVDLASLALQCKLHYFTVFFLFIVGQQKIRNLLEENLQHLE